MLCNDNHSKLAPESTCSRVSKVEPVDKLHGDKFVIFVFVQVLSLHRQIQECRCYHTHVLTYLNHLQHFNYKHIPNM